MLVDWFTVGAQGLNFLILVWLLKRFLYKPILKAIDQREQRIAAELADADARREEARQERDAFRQKNAEFDEAQENRMKEAIDEADRERQRLIEEAHKAAELLRLKRDKALRHDALTLNRSIASRAQQEVFAIARQTLMDLSGESLDECVGDLFIRRLRDINGPPREQLAEAARTASGPVLVRSAFELAPSVCEAIRQALNTTLESDLPVRFEVSPELVAGIELSTNGQKVAWSIADYLRGLEEGVAELLQESGKPEPESGSEPEQTGESETISSAGQDAGQALVKPAQATNA